MVRTVVLFYVQVELHVLTYLTTKNICIKAPDLFKCWYYRQIVHRKTHRNPKLLLQILFHLFGYSDNYYSEDL